MSWWHHNDVIIEHESKICSKYEKINLFLRRKQWETLGNTDQKSGYTILKMCGILAENRSLSEERRRITKNKNGIYFTGKI